METLLTIEQAATRLQLHRDTVRRQIKRGALRAVKRGRVWRVPESALEEVIQAPEVTPGIPTTQTSGAHSITATLLEADALWRDMTSERPRSHNAAIIALAQAPAAVRALITGRSAEAAALYYATAEGEAELADWRALDGEPFHDDDGSYYSDDEEAQLRAQRAAKGSAQ